jgi:hypothetical protein
MQGIDLASMKGFIKKTLSDIISFMECKEGHVGSDDDEEEEN